MSECGRTFAAAWLGLAVLLFPAGWADRLVPARAQEHEIERPGPPAQDEMEVDANKDGVPDGWYNALDTTIMNQGGPAGPHFIRFECKKRGRLARLSRAFGVDGRKTEAIILGLWIRLGNIQYGERQGEQPGLLIDFINEKLLTSRRGAMGPWTHTVGNRWTRVVKRIAVPPDARDSIMSVGLLGAAGILDIDGLTVELVPRAEAATTNLVVNGGFELGDPAPTHWIVNNEAHRVFPGHASGAAVELAKSGSRILTGLALPVEGLGNLELSVSARGQGLRGAGGAESAFFFLDDFGQPIPGSEKGIEALAWSGSFDWRTDQVVVAVPPRAARAVIQFEKTDGIGSLRIDDVRITAAPNPEAASWEPFHADDETEGWLSVPPSPEIVARSALDVSFLVPAPAGQKGFVSSKEGRLVYEKGGRARFHGVSMLPPAAFLEPERADQLADRLSRSGVNLVRLGDLDMPIGPDRSLFDDTRDDTKAFDPLSLEKLDHLIAALKSRGIHVALEIQGDRRFRDGDGVPLAGLLPPGGGPAALFDPRITKLGLQSARDLLGRVNSETKLALRDDPVLAWVTLLGEVSLFDLVDRPDDALPGEYAQALRTLGQKSTSGAGTGRRLWQVLESDHYKTMADALRKDKLRVPIAGCSHWRREPEFVAAQAAAPLDLIDDRLFWMPPAWLNPDLRSQLWSLDGGLNSGAQRKRQPGRPYVVGQWCPQTKGAWALPHEAADQLLAAQTAVNEDWDALVRRGIFMFPITWGTGPAGTVGGEDIYQIPEVVNASPHVYAVWPHVASLLLRGQSVTGKSEREREREPDHGGRGQTVARRRPRGLAGWDPTRGRLAIDTPYTQGIAGWWSGEPASLPNLEVSADNPFAVVVASSVGPEPIASAGRLLVTVIGRVEPTGFRWVDPWKREVADPGGPPFLQEPVTARVSWKRKGKIQAYVLNNAGERVGPAKLGPMAGGEGVTLVIDTPRPAFHWELVAE
jgi:hypothetical protein